MGAPVQAGHGLQASEAPRDDRETAVTTEGNDIMSERLHTAAVALADIARGMYDADGLASLQCAEVEAIADVLRAIDAHDAADIIIAAHAEGDDEGDGHFGLAE